MGRQTSDLLIGLRTAFGGTVRCLPGVEASRHADYFTTGEDEDGTHRAVSLLAVYKDTTQLADLMNALRDAGLPEYPPSSIRSYLDLDQVASASDLSINSSALSSSK